MWYGSVSWVGGSFVSRFLARFVFVAKWTGGRRNARSRTSFFDEKGTINPLVTDNNNEINVVFFSITNPSKNQQPVNYVNEVQQVQQERSGQTLSMYPNAISCFHMQIQTKINDNGELVGKAAKKHWTWVFDEVIMGKFF